MLVISHTVTSRKEKNMIHTNVWMKLLTTALLALVAPVVSSTP